jgi:copper transport protein
MRKVLVGLVMVGGLILAGATPAWAHANLASSDPANGATLPNAPAAIHLTFTEAPDPTLSTITVLNAGGTKLAMGPVTLDPPRTLTATMPSDVPDGVYTVSWRTVSTVDGHVTASAFAFGVGTTTAPITPGTVPPASVSGPNPLSVAAKTALYAGLMLLVAAAVVGLGLFRGAPRALRIVGLVAAIVGFAGAMGLLIAEQRSVGVSVDALLRTPTGRPYGWLVIATLAAAVFAVIAAARERWRVALSGAGAAAAVAMAIRVASGHAAAAPDPLLQQGYQWLHFFFAGLWVGGLVLLLLLLRERVADRNVPPVAETRRFSDMALIAVGVVALTGALRAVNELGGLSNVLDALHRAYGITLLVKVAVALVLIALGATNRLRNVVLLAEDPRPLRRFVTGETIVAVGVLVLTGVLTGLNPPASAITAASTALAPVAGTATGADFATTTRVSLTATPGSPGPNAFRALVTDYDTGAPFDADGVTLRFVSVTHPDLPASQVRLSRQPDGGWAGQGVTMSVAGTWRVTALVRTGASTTEVPLTLITVSDGTTSTVAIAGAPATATTSFPDGVSLQSFAEPATAGPNPVHVTAFAPNGNELALRDAVIVVTPDGGEPIRPQTHRFSAGHLAANTTLDAGDYVVDIVATARDGVTYESTWRLTIAPAPSG